MNTEARASRVAPASTGELLVLVRLGRPDEVRVGFDDAAERAAVASIGGPSPSVSLRGEVSRLYEAVSPDDGGLVSHGDSSRQWRADSLR